jgi:hypothetical protein
MLLGNNPNHCGRLNCRCTHTEGCEKGFIAIRYVDKQEKIRQGQKIVVETWYDGVHFCSICDPERAHIQQSSQSSEEMGQRLRERSKYKHAENYEQKESDKTKTL